ncbi:MAG: polyprenyl synthetase family protein [Actinomycetaceae bacterium]|nr:polyprenyl synthetase family protein [Actinomycetaceae bacterium]MDY6082699.1 polyprenyl synthetase family protein [Actinomycetaceae bacterium]
MNFPYADGTLGEVLGQRMDRVERELMVHLSVGDGILDPVTSHLAQAGGKRLRPALVLLTAELGTHPDAQAVFDSAVVVELTHLASLYHDDVMDEAPKRRGVDAAQKVYGNSRAILAGDILFARASVVISHLGPRAVELHARTFERLCKGQFHETAGVQPGVNMREFYLSVLSDKTASLIAASARYGVLSSGGSEEVADAVARFGERIGVAFQIADDVIDIVSDGATTGKTPGTDLRDGVATMPTILLQEQAQAGTLDDAGMRILNALRGDLSSDEALADVVGMLRAHPVMEQTQAIAEQWLARAEVELEAVPEGEVRDALLQFGRMSVQRVA